MEVIGSTEMTISSAERIDYSGFIPCVNAPGYEVNRDGVVKKAGIYKIMKAHYDKDGYERVTLQIHGKPKGFRIHRLMAEAFIPNPENKPNVNHKNGVKHDNRVSNLEWCTQKENFSHARGVLKVGMHAFSVDEILMRKLQGMIDLMEDLKKRDDCTRAMEEKINRALRNIRN